MTDYLVGVAQEMSHWLTKTMFLGEVETEITSRFGALGFSTGDTILGLWFSL